MKKLSRWMPAAPQHHTRWWAWLILLPMLPFVLSMLIIILVLYPIFWLAQRKHRRRMHWGALERFGEHIGTFAREFDLRRTDTWVLRAVYEELSKYGDSVAGRPVPIRAADRWEEDLLIDPEDMEMDVMPAIAYRAGRSLEHTENNPYYNRVVTIRDIVGFLEHQPRLRRT